MSKGSLIISGTGLCAFSHDKGGNVHCPLISKSNVEAPRHIIIIIIIIVIVVIVIAIVIIIAIDIAIAIAIVIVIVIVIVIILLKGCKHVCR